MKAYKEVVTQQELFEVELATRSDCTDWIDVFQRDAGDVSSRCIANVTKDGMYVNYRGVNVLNLSNLINAQATLETIPERFKTAIIDEYESNNNVLKLTNEEANLLFRLLYCHVAHEAFNSIHMKLADLIDYESGTTKEEIDLVASVGAYGVHYLHKRKP